MNSPPSPVTFERHAVTLEGVGRQPAISNVKFVRLSETGPIQLLICDMRHGLVAIWTPSRPAEPAKILGRVPHPSQTEVVDFDGNGNLDIIVAVFGSFVTGMVLYLENVTTDYSTPEFEPSVVDGRTGTSDVPIVDLNRDGRPGRRWRHGHCLVCVHTPLPPGSPQARSVESVIWLKQTQPGKYQRYVVETGSTVHPCLDLGDFDGDGDIDLAVGNYILIPHRRYVVESCVTVLENRTVRAEEQPLNSIEPLK